MSLYENTHENVTNRYLTCSHMVYTTDLILLDYLQISRSISQDEQEISLIWSYDKAVLSETNCKICHDVNTRKQT